MTMTLTVMVILPNLPWLTSSLLEPSTTNCASGNRMLARTHLISEASVGWRRKKQISPPLTTCSHLDRAHHRLATAGASRVAVHLSIQAERRRVGREVGILKQGARLQVGLQNFFVVLPIQAVLLSPGVGHCTQPSSLRGRKRLWKINTK